MALMIRKTNPVLIILLSLLAIAAEAGGIRGIIKGDDGTALAYATIFVKQTGTGSASDLNGRFDVPLAAGNYEVIFHYLGYETEVRKIEVGADYIDLNITLKTQVVVLQNVTVRAGKEDPAYTIMRKAIAKAKFHTQQIDSYTAKVYIKGKGKLKDYPWLAKKALEKEGITKDRLFIQESVSEIKYTRPNKFEEKVIAVYTSGKNNETSPNEYVFGSFYESEIAETVSPLSPKSFSFYRFEYLGSFKDRNFEISKIKVTPRSKGDDVFEGVIYIVEDWWSIHSLDLVATKMGINFKIKQIYDAVEGDAGPGKPKGQAWLPVSQQFHVSGKVFGFDFEGTYLATVKDYKVNLNPALQLELTVVDEKINKEQAKQVKQQFSKKGQQLKERVEAGNEVTNKELRKLVREYEKAELKEEKEPEVISETKHSIDSLAYKMDSAFWAKIRPVPLDIEEIRGYKKADSVSEVQRKREEGDSLKPSKSKGFQPWDVLIGDRYKISKTSDFEIHTPLGGFNTVEGVNLIYRMSYYKRWVKRDTLNPSARPQVKRLEVSPILRYSFAREKLTGYLRADYRTRLSRLTVEGGRYIQQFNSDEPIHPLVNTFTTLFMERNLMKIYERDFVDLSYRKRLDERFTFRTNWSWAKRYQLNNNSSFTLINLDKEAYTSNTPVNLELSNTDFSTNVAFIGAIGIDARPWQKYKIRNGYKYRVDGSSPLLTLDYRKGFDQVLNSEVKFDLVELGARYVFKVGVIGRLDMNLKGGIFLNADKMYFMDYKHFIGNQTPFMTTDPVGSFRLMDYYLYSTRDKYFSANIHYHFRKFLFTRIPKVRMLGISENIFVNYLATPMSMNYTELGYGVDGILRVFGLEAAVNFIDGQYQNVGFRIGIATSISANFND